MSFDIVAGGALALVGESGCGKTTTARMVVGLERPTSGGVFWSGDQLGFPSSTRERRHRAQLMQLVFQNPYASLNPSRTVERTLSEVVRFHTPARGAAAARRVQELARQVGLSKAELAQRPKRKSGGQCQRAAIARALAADPKLLILDEAVSALDVSTQAQILNLVAELRRRLGIAILLITHDLAVVRQVCDEVVVMNGGKVVESGPAHVILSHPSDPYTKRLIGSVPRGPRGRTDW